MLHCRICLLFLGLLCAHHWGWAFVPKAAPFFRSHLHLSSGDLDSLWSAPKSESARIPTNGAVAYDESAPWLVSDLKDKDKPSQLEMDKESRSQDATETERKHSMQLERLFTSFMSSVIFPLKDRERGVYYEDDDTTLYGDDIGNRERQEKTFDCLRASKQHRQMIFALVRSDVQTRSDDEEMLEVEKKIFPASYSRAITMIEEILLGIGESEEMQPLLSLAKFVLKKEGLLRGSQAGGLLIDERMSTREVVEIKRRVERCLSLLLLLSITHRSLQHDPTQQQDLLFFGKSIAEHVPVQERHFALIVLCRGILAPSYKHVNPSSGAVEMVDAQSLARSPLPPLRGSFLQNMAKYGTKQPSVTTKMLYPFAAFALRSHSALNEIPREEEEWEWEEEEEGKGEDIKSGSSSGFDRHDATLCRVFQQCRHMDLQAERANGLEGSANGLLLNVRRWLQELSAVHFINDESTRMLLQTTPEEIRRNTVAMELLSTHDAFVLGRRQARLSYGRLQADLGKKLSLVLSLFPPSLSVSPSDAGGTAGSAGTGADVSAGGSGATTEHADLSDGSGGAWGGDSASSFSSWENDDFDRLEWSESGGGEGNWVSSEDSAVLASAKKLMAVVNAVGFLPPGHALRRSFEAIMGLDEYKRLDDRALEYKMAALRDNLASIRIEGSYSGGLGRAGGRGSNSNDDLFGNKDKDKRGSGGTGIGGQTPRNGRSGGDMGDDDLFSRGGRGGLDRRGSRNKRMQQKILSILGQGQGFRSSSGGRRGQNLDQEKQESLALLHREIDQFLYKVVALTVQVHPSVIGTSDEIKREIQEVYRTWRSPLLLLDYHRIHNAHAPEVQALYRRFLRGLFGISKETVDDVRYCDKGNRQHLSMFPAQVVRPWIEGRCPESGQLLPGYNDAQTLFMLGEDSGTCMMVRARQKSTNRALLSFVLHGNVRVLGTKDATGKLQQRAVCRLLVDQATKAPVLYVETPMGRGSGSDTANVLDVYDQAAELGALLRVAVIHAVKPSAKHYCCGPHEISATEGVMEMDERVFQSKDEEEGSSSPSSLRSETETDPDADAGDVVLEPPAAPLQMSEFALLEDHTDVSPYVWVDGIRDPLTGRYVRQLTPRLFKRALAYEEESAGHCIAGYRSPGSLERVLREVGVDIGGSDEGEISILTTKCVSWQTDLPTLEALPTMNAGKSESEGEDRDGSLAAAFTFEDLFASGGNTRPKGRIKGAGNGNKNKTGWEAFRRAGRESDLTTTTDIATDIDIDDSDGVETETKGKGNGIVKGRGRGRMSMQEMQTRRRLALDRMVKGRAGRLSDMRKGETGANEDESEGEEGDGEGEREGDWEEKEEFDASEDSVDTRTRAAEPDENDDTDDLW